MVKAGGMRVLSHPAELAPTLGELLSDPALAREAGRRGREAVEAGRGAIEATVALIESNLLKRT